MKLSKQAAQQETFVQITISLDTMKLLLKRHALHVSDFSCNSEQSKALIHEVLLNAIRR